MMIFGFKRGHQIDYINGEWVYHDDKTTIEIERPCMRCGRMSTKEGYDACLGYIKGVKAACCGHGKEEPYRLTAGNRV